MQVSTLWQTMGNRLIKIEEFVLLKREEMKKNISHGLVVISKTKILDRVNQI